MLWRWVHAFLQLTPGHLLLSLCHPSSGKSSNKLCYWKCCIRDAARCAPVPYNLFLLLVWRRDFRITCQSVSNQVHKKKTDFCITCVPRRKRKEGSKNQAGDENQKEKGKKGNAILGWWENEKRIYRRMGWDLLPRLECFDNFGSLYFCWVSYLAYPRCCLQI